MEQENPFGNEPEQIPSEQSERYLPEELGLDPEKKEDMKLYKDSKGIRDAALVLIERRKLENGYLSGEISPEHYDLQRKGFDEVLEIVFAEHGIEAP